MRRTIFLLGVTLVAGLAAGLLGDRLLDAQPVPAKVTELLRTDLAGMEGKELIVQLVEVAPGAATGRHFHPGHEVAYVLDGTGLLEIEGRPPALLKAGEVNYIPARQVHEGRNAGTSTPLRLVVFRIHEKGQPVTIRVP